METKLATKTIQFSPIDNIEEYNFHPVLKRFYGMGIQGLVRENIQNSIDGKLINSDKPVVVHIQTGIMGKSRIPGIREIAAHIHSLSGRNTYTKETIEHMKKCLLQENVRYISFEDENTRGLTGARNGQSNSANDTFGIYAYNKGFHSEESDQQLETARGGSHGIGKIASNAASDIHLMYFANCDENGEQHLGGTIQLIEHIFEDKCYRATGYFSNVQSIGDGKTKYVPFENTFDDIFKKNTRGLKIVIPFLREEFDNEIHIIQTICDNFFVAILNNSLIVHVNDHIISAETLSTYVNDTMYYQQEISQMKKEYTPLYVQTYLTAEPRQLTVNNGVKDYHFKLYFTYNEDIPKGRMAIFRTMGMKIEDFKVANNATKPFNAVLIGGLEEDKYLKSLENESHTKISNENIDDPKLKRQATRFINKLSAEMSKIIDEEMRKYNVPDGEMDTTDLLYTVETSFKEDLKHVLGTVVINQGNPIVKTSIDSPSKKKGENEGTGRGGRKDGKKEGDKSSSGGEGNKLGTGIGPNSGLKRRKGKIQTSDEMAESKEIYSVNPNLVERITLMHQEVLHFNFTQLDVMKKVKTCDISFRIIDGKGEEYSFDLQSNYEAIINRNTKKSYQMEGQTVKNVELNKGLIDLSIQLKPSCNRNLKFIYYVEV